MAWTVGFQDNMMCQLEYHCLEHRVDPEREREGEREKEGEGGGEMIENT